MVVHFADAYKLLSKAIATRHIGETPRAMHVVKERTYSPAVLVFAQSRQMVHSLFSQVTMEGTLGAQS